VSTLRKQSKGSDLNAMKVFFKNLVVNLLISLIPALFLLIFYPHDSFKTIIFLTVGTLILAVYLVRYIIKSIRVGHVLNPSGGGTPYRRSRSTRSRRDEEPISFWFSIMLWGAISAIFVWLYIMNIDIFFNRNTPIHQAARLGGDIKFLKKYFNSGGDVNLKTSSWFRPEYAGNTLLHDAVKGDSFEVVKFLIEKEADLNQTNNAGRTPLSLAIRNKHSDIADLLRKHGGKAAEELKAEGK